MTHSNKTMRTVSILGALCAFIRIQNWTASYVNVEVFILFINH